MELSRINHTISQLQFGHKSSFQDGTLILNQSELIDYTLNGLEGFELSFSFASPGKSQRIIHVTDTVMPSYKKDYPSFRGWTGLETESGRSVTHHTKNLAITQSFAYPGIQEGIIDMSGKGAEYSVFSDLFLLVMLVKLTDESKTKPEIAKSLIQLNLRAAEYVGKIVSNATGELKKFKLDPVDKLPRIGYAYFIQAQGPLRNVHVYAQDCVNMTPRFMNPNEILDGAIVSGNYIIACQKNPTWLHQNNPIILDAYKRHGKEIDFVGVIVSTEQSLLEGKKSNAEIIARLAKENNLDGVILTQEGGGHADVDLMLTAEECEKNGIKVVMLVNEIAGPEGALPPLVSWTSKADAVVSTGNNDEIITLPAMDEAIGGDTITGGRSATGEIVTSLGIVYTATNQLGVGRMTTVER